MKLSNSPQYEFQLLSLPTYQVSIDLSSEHNSEQTGPISLANTFVKKTAMSMWGIGAEADVTSDGEGGEAVPDVPDGVNHGILRTRARWSHFILNKWHKYQNGAPNMTKYQAKLSPGFC